MNQQFNFIQFDGEQKKQSQIELKDNDEAWRFGNQLFDGSPEAAQVTYTEYANHKITVRVMSKHQMLYKIQSV